MNKIKLMYDIAKTMKEKDAVNGMLQMECTKDQSIILQMDNEFSKDFSTGLTKFKIRTESDYEGKHLKHVSSTEFVHAGGHFHGHRSGCAHGFSGAHGFKGKHPHYRHFHSLCGHGHGGLKGLFSGFALALDILNKTEVEAQSDNSYIITLEMTKLPEEMQQILSHKFRRDSLHHERGHFGGNEQGDEQGKEQRHERGHGWRHECMQEPHHHHCLHKELQNLTDPNLTLISRVNRNNEIESIDLNLTGTLAGDSGEKKTLSLKAKLAFIYN